MFSSAERSLQVKTLKALLVIFWAFTIVIAVAVVSSLLQDCSIAYASSEEEHYIDQLTEAVFEHQPFYRRVQKAKARRLATIIAMSALGEDIPPMIALTVALRESALLHKVGSLGELGIFQVHPTGRAKIVCSGGCDLSLPTCNARTAMCWLSKARDICGESPWLWIGGYGRSRCPRDIEEAKTWDEVKRARRILCELTESCSVLWPE